MMKIIRKILFGLLLIALLFSFVTKTNGQSCSNKQECEKLIQEYTQKLTELGDQRRTLASQIEFMDTQIYLTGLQIQDTENKIVETEKEIENLTGRIDNLNVSLDYLSQILLQKIVAGYKHREAPFLDIFIDADSAATLANRIKYARVTEENDRKVAFQMQQAKLNFEEQKSLREEKKIELDQLKVTLDAHNADLENQKSQKQQLLIATQNDEQKFQILIAKLKADAASINAAIGNIGEKIGPVNKGDIIAGVGSSGCSTGPHLHFEVYTNAKVEGGRIVGSRTDPKPYLENPSYAQPVPGYPGNVTTWYGEVYFLGTHTGIDIANPFGTPIRAIESGEAYSTSAVCSYSIAGGSPVGKGIVVDHNNGLVTLYWHIP